jgi:hypothetical protein
MVAAKKAPGSMASYNTGRKTEDIVKELELRVKALEARLLIVEPQLQMMEQYPALKTAYNEYKLIERLIINQGE